MKIDSLGSINQSLPADRVKTVEKNRMNETHNQLHVEELKKIEEIDKEHARIEELVEMTNGAMKNLGQMMHFDVHKESERLFVTIVEVQSDKVLKTIPSKEFLDLVGRIQESVGLIIDEKM